MKAVIDEDLPRSLAAVLTSHGFEAIDIRDTKLRGKSDNFIFSFTLKNKAVLFSADLGFSNTLSFPLGYHYGIVILRFPNEMSVNRVNLEAERLLKKLKVSDYKGNLIVLTPGKIRIRKPQKN